MQRSPLRMLPEAWETLLFWKSTSSTFFLEKYTTAQFSQPPFIPEIWSFPIGLIT